MGLALQDERSIETSTKERRTQTKRRANVSESRLAEEATPAFVRQLSRQPTASYRASFLGTSDFHANFDLPSVQALQILGRLKFGCQICAIWNYADKIARFLATYRKETETSVQNECTRSCST